MTVITDRSEHESKVDDEAKSQESANSDDDVDHPSSQEKVLLILT